MDSLVRNEIVKSQSTNVFELEPADLVVKLYVTFSEKENVDAHIFRFRGTCLKIPFMKGKTGSQGSRFLPNL